MNSVQEKYASRNPIPGYIDQITTQPMMVPTLSPDYFVLDYSTWIALLSYEKYNPFTKTPMSEKDLIILTEENFKEYRTKIVNLEENCPPDQ